ncbi:MAG: metallophosphoesterase [Desulfobacterota bacterium]|nr:metallophosphoesterase [Thermodesulfobacteriota bacterium]
MQIGVISDTHIPFTAPELPRRVLDLLSGMDAIIHAGDYQDPSIIDTLMAIAPFYGVAGNMDGEAVRLRVPDKTIVTLGGFSIGIIHGWGSPRGLEDRVAAAFADAMPNVIVYGHSHNPAISWRETTLLFNPGSPTDRHYARSNSIGILKLDTAVQGEIIPVEAY